MPEDYGIPSGKKEIFKYSMNDHPHPAPLL
jgi:hypothetical protein